MISAPSGEIYFHANAIGEYGRQSLPSIQTEFWEFLETLKKNSSSSSSRDEGNEDDSVLIQSTIKSTLEAYLLKLRYHIQFISKNLELQHQKNCQEIGLFKFSLMKKIENLKEQNEKEIMKCILNYYKIIEKELKNSKEFLGNEQNEKILQQKQIKILRDVRFFSNHLIIESKGKISFQMISSDSQQFHRCIKAVHDNIQLQQKPFYKKNEIKVLNVFKLSNYFLSQKLQFASEKVTNGKIKGLFCCLSKESFYNFSVYGLHSQILPSQQQKVDNLSALAAAWLRTVWFQPDLPPAVASGRITSEVSNVLNSLGTAAKLSSSRSKDFLSSILFFSRYSTIISDFNKFTEEQLNEGIFLSLCRVLVVKQKTIMKEIEEVDIIEAIQQNYDCLYSSLQEQYVLLQPKYVLPEFFMHTRFPFRKKDDQGASPIKQQPGSDMMVIEKTLADTMLTSSKQSSIEAEESTFPLENLLLHNAMECTSSCAGTTGLLSMDLEHDVNEVELQEHIDDATQSPGQGMIKKQEIVKKLHSIVQDYRTRSSKEITSSIRSLADNLQIQL